MYHMVARSKPLSYVHIMNSRFVRFAQQTEILALHSIHRVVCIREDSVYSAVGNKPLNMQLLLNSDFKCLIRQQAFLHKINHRQAGRQDLYEKLFITDTHSSQTVLSHSCCSCNSQTRHKITLYFNTKLIIPCV